QPLRLAGGWMALRDLLLLTVGRKFVGFMNLLNQGARMRRYQIFLFVSLGLVGLGRLVYQEKLSFRLVASPQTGGASLSQKEIVEIEEIGFPVFSRSVTPATSVGRYVSVAKQVPVTCAGVLVRPGDYIVGDWTGVAVVPADKIAEVVDLLRKYDEKESKMIPIIRETKSMLKALEKYNRY